MWPSCADCGEARRRLEKMQLALTAACLMAEAAQIEFAPFWREVQHRIDAKRRLV